MKYITDLFDTLWDDKLEDRTAEVKAENQRLAKSREVEGWPTAADSKKASDTYAKSRIQQ